MKTQRSRRSDEKFWLTLPQYSAEFAAEAMARFRAKWERLRSTKRHNRMLRSWLMYYKYGRNGACDDTEIGEAGKKGELLLIHSSRYRRNIQDYLAQVMQTPPEPRPMALNSDPESQAQSMLCQGILDWYRRVGHLEAQRTERAEVAAVMGESFAHARWDPELGDKKRAPVEEGGEPVYEGDFVFSVRTPYEVAHERTSADKSRPGWWVVQEPMNRWDLLAQFGDDEKEGDPEHGMGQIESAIRGAQSWTEVMGEWDFEDANNEEHDDSIPIYWVYGDLSKALPEGRRALVLDDSTVLLDTGLDEDRPGVFRCAPSEVILRNEGHTNNFHAMGMQEAHSGQLSMILSNQDAFGGSRIKSPKKGSVSLEQLAANLSLIEYDDWDSENERELRPPEVMDLANTSPELFSMAEMLGSEIDLAMGGSPVTRGDPQATKGDSGAKGALLLAQAQQVYGGAIQALLATDEEIFTHIIASLRRHATVERLTTLAGTANVFAAQEYTNQDLDRINRVLVERPNAARDTFQGRMAIAEMLSGKPKDEQERITSLIYTGRLEPQTEDVEHARLSRERENQALRDPSAEMPRVLPYEDHMAHLQDHRDCGQSWEVRANPEIAERFLVHMREHIAKLTMGSPGYAGDEILMGSLQKPIGHIDPMSGQFKPGMPGGGGASPPGGPGATPPPPKPGGPPSGPPSPPKPSNGENMVKVQTPDMPTNPATGEQVSPGNGAALPEPVI